MKRTSLIFNNPTKIELRQDPVPSPGEGEVLIKTHVSAISPGSEMLVYRGQFPSNLAVDEQIPALTHKFKYPLKYGYASVGKIIEVGRTVQRSYLNQMVFCFHPHESHYIAEKNQLVPIPPDIEPLDAVFLPNMETAVGFLMDGRPVIGESVIVFGQGIVGLLTTALLAMFPLSALGTLDPFPGRRKISIEVGAHFSLDPGTPDLRQDLTAAVSSASGNGHFDLAYEVSGNPEALNQVIDVAGFGARLVIGSWYGSKKVLLDLGNEFHRNRIQIISSQVSTLAPEFSGRWSKDRRLHLAWEMIRRLKPASFITHRFSIQKAQKAYEMLDKKPQEAIQVVLTYEH